MSDAEAYLCSECGEEHADPTECPEFDLATADDEDDPEPTEIREGVVNDLATAHVAAVVICTFPREDNDLDTVDFGTASFGITSDMSETEMIAGKSIVSDGIAILHDEFGEPSRPARAEPSVTAIPAGGLMDMLAGQAGGEDDGGESGNTPAGF